MSEQEKKSYKSYIYALIFFLAIGSFIGYEMVYGIFTNESQFNYSVSWIETTEFICEEGFDGTNYGHTGEIHYYRGLLSDSPTMNPLIPNTMTDEQIKTLSDMLISKLQTLPCYDEYLELEKRLDEKVMD